MNTPDKEANLNAPEKSENSEETQTPITPETRTTGSGAQGETKPSASPETPSGGRKAGAPNQGTEAR